MTSRLSLWVMPASRSSNEKGWVQASTEAASMVSLTMSPITPHVTLASWTEPHPDVKIEEFAKHAAFRLKPCPTIQTGDSFWMCVFAELALNPDLSRLRALAEAIRPDTRSGTYRPHTSLVYGDVDAKTKMMVARAMDCFIPPTFSCDRVCLVNTSDQNHLKWRIVDEVQLEGIPKGGV